MSGIFNKIKLAANQAFTSNATAATLTGLTVPVPVNSVMWFHAKIFFTVGATGGVRIGFNFDTSPAALVGYAGHNWINNTVAGTIIGNGTTTIVGSILANALANAGTHAAELYCVFQSPNAGNLLVQGAQNTSDVLTCTFLANSWLEFGFM